MISINNKTHNDDADDQDFTIDAYRQLISLVQTSYQVTDYRSIPWGQRFLLWRHDCDISLHRAVALAKIESEMGLRSTFFVNLHCEFYNLFELSQLMLVKEIVQLGHDIGLHFDADLYDITSEVELHKQVSYEADLIGRYVGVCRPSAFSFHNPSTFHLTCEEDSYGGLVNCYSKRFKSEVSYCSDSNGYWRFRRLFDVLDEAKDPCIQVLTHPGWWQDKPMPPRQRIFRSAYGRATAAMRIYDQSLADYGRINHTGKEQAIRFLELVNPELFELCDFLWNSEQYKTLYMELWRLHEGQINRLCKAMLFKEWGVPVQEINTFFEHEGISYDGWQLFKEVFGDSWKSASGQSDATHQTWLILRNQLIHGRSSVEPIQIEIGCVYLCNVIQSISVWGLTQVIAYDGLAEFDLIEHAKYKSIIDSLSEQSQGIEGDTLKPSGKRWEVLKKNMMMDNASNSTKVLSSD